MIGSCSDMQMPGEGRVVVGGDTSIFEQHVGFGGAFGEGSTASSTTTTDNGFNWNDTRAGPGGFLTGIAPINTRYSPYRRHYRGNGGGSSGSEGEDDVVGGSVPGGRAFHSNEPMRYEGFALKESSRKAFTKARSPMVTIPGANGGNGARGQRMSEDQPPRAGMDLGSDQGWEMGTGPGVFLPPHKMSEEAHGNSNTLAMAAGCGSSEMSSSPQTFTVGSYMIRGLTLRGRDALKMRTAVLTQTGFLEEGSVDPDDPEGIFSC